MDYDYTFYTTEDYQEWYGRCVPETEYHGVTVNIDKNDNVLSWYGYGDFGYEISLCKTVEQLRDYIKSHLNEVQEFKGDNFSYTNKELFEELIDILNDNIEQKKCA